jgi:hypothetical protein
MLSLLSSQPSFTDAKPGGSPSDQCITMRNWGNVQYTISSFYIADQQLDMIPDTGSSALVVPCQKCTDSCGHHKRYDFTKSEGFKMLHDGTEYVSSYGQGEVVGVLVEDDISIGGSSTRQTFLAMENSQLAGYIDGAAFDGIVGLGPRLTTGDGSPTVISQLAQGEVGVCLSQGDAANGALFMADYMPKSTKWIEVPLSPKDEHHYQVTFGSMEVKGTTAYENLDAIVDSGTSFLLFPNSIIEQFDKLGVPDVDIDCSNIDEMPTLEFKHSSGTVKIPPAAYIGKLSGSLSKEMVDSGVFSWVLDKVRSQAKKKKAEKAEKSGGNTTELKDEDWITGGCAPLIGASDMVEVAILGMPLYRSNAVIHNAIKKIAKFAAHSGDCGVACNENSVSDEVLHSGQNPLLPLSIKEAKDEVAKKMISKGKAKVATIDMGKLTLPPLWKYATKAKAETKKDAHELKKSKLPPF